MESGQAASSLPPCFSAKRLGPEGTIAKETQERKEKSQKRLKKCEFFEGHVEITAKNALWRRALFRKARVQAQICTRLSRTYRTGVVTTPSKASPDIQRFTALVRGAYGVCLQLQGGQVCVEVGDGLDSAEIVFQGDVLVAGVCVFVR